MTARVTLQAYPGNTNAYAVRVGGAQVGQVFQFGRTPGWTAVIYGSDANEFKSLSRTFLTFRDACAWARATLRGSI